MTNRTAASFSSGYDRSTIRPSTIAARARLARRDESSDATVDTGVPADAARVDPSGRATLI